MNEKTAKLIRKYAQGTETNERELKRRWNEMSQKERAAFRLEMAAKVGETTETAEASEG